jgi:hypothetical protein
MKLNKDKSYAERISKECCEIIKSNFEKSTSIFIIEDETDNHYFAIVGGDESLAQTDTGEQIKIVRFFEIFWIHFSLRFNIKLISPKHYKYDLGCVNIKIFKDSEEERNKKLLFRAEWNENSNTIHAQPHWHIEPEKIYFIQEENDFNSLLELNSKTNDLFNPLQNSTSQKKIFKYSKFHYAMSSEWHKGNNHSQILNDENLKKWLKGCIEYIKKELKYCY